jgi:HlyD family secretion protein
MATLRTSTQVSIRRHLYAGFIVFLLVGAGVGGWAACTDLAGAVIATGHLVVDSHVKKVQHATGGIVMELRVREGVRVKAGDVLVRLDETQVRATAVMLAKDLDELRAQQARLEAEREDLDRLDFPPDLVGRSDDADVARAISGERRLFELRRAARAGQKAQLRERISQLWDEVKGLTGQLAAKAREVDFIHQELAAVRELWNRKLVPLNQLTSLQRDEARLDGERSQLVGYLAEAKGKVTEIELQIIQIDEDLRTEVGKDLAEIRPKISELFERKIAAEDQLMRMVIRAPQNGRVHQLEVHTVGGVVSPGEPIMLIVPDADSLTVEAKVLPHDIDQLHPGQSAVIRFTSFNQRTTPEVTGEVTLISADSTQDQRTGAEYYTIRITPDAKQVARLNGVKLMPGMPVEAFVRTGERTVLSYLMKPLRDQINRAFREN